MKIDALFFHYQWVRSDRQRLTVHEAYDKESKLYAVCPLPIESMGDPELELKLEEALEKYGIVDFRSIKEYINTYTEEFEVDYTITLPEYSFEDYTDDEIDELEDDPYDDEGNVIDLVEFLKRRK